MRAPLAANARMYAVNAAASAAWAALFGWVAQASGVALSVIDHAAPAPLEALWRRGDLGLAFICGLPLGRGDFPLRAVAAPVPASPLGAGRPVYATHFIVRGDSAIATLADSFGLRIGWTAEHSQSGFSAPARHLRALSQGGARLYAEAVGPLQTPRRVIEAVLAGEIEIGPLDSYFHDLLLAHEPQTAARLRIVATTQPTPMPVLAASGTVDVTTTGLLRRVLVAAGATPAAAPLLARLRLAGFAPAEPAAYRGLAEADAAIRAVGVEALF